MNSLTSNQTLYASERNTDATELARRCKEICKAHPDLLDNAGLDRCAAAAVLLKDKLLYTGTDCQLVLGTKLNLSSSHGLAALNNVVLLAGEKSRKRLSGNIGHVFVMTDRYLINPTNVQYGLDDILSRADYHDLFTNYVTCDVSRPDGMSDYIDWKVTKGKACSVKPSDSKKKERYIWSTW